MRRRQLLVQSISDEELTLLLLKYAAEQCVDFQPSTTSCYVCVEANSHYDCYWIPYSDAECYINGDYYYILSTEHKRLSRYRPWTKDLLLHHVCLRFEDDSNNIR